MRALLAFTLALVACVPVAQPVPSTTTAPAPTFATPAPTPEPTPFSCDGAVFCYPALGIAGDVTVYDDASGQSDIGLGIRSLAKYPTYLVGHAWSPFGRIVAWHAGDTIELRGVSYTVYDAVHWSCGASIEALIASGATGPVWMQTSLAPGCGETLVVMAR